MSRDILEQATAIAKHGPNIAYPSRASAEHVRNIVRGLIKEITEQGARLARYEARDEADADQL